MRRCRQEEPRGREENDPPAGTASVTREQILDNLWGVDYAAESNVVDRHVSNLRTKLQDDWRRPRFVATVPGRGYRFLPATT
ncbi:MAG: winged helix-turn-helix domain-containing protein [Chloroflexi bacterium]|nr:MAG: winged helix-turn-helix domain-containing protein [Chloroflexota bacterium]